MIPTKDLLLARLQWPSPPEDKGQARKHKAALTAARRCLIDSAPATLHATGFQLLKKADEPELDACLERILSDIDIQVQEVLVIMPAPGIDVYTDKLYQQTASQLTQDLADSLYQIADKIPEGKLTSRLFNPAHLRLDILCRHVHDKQILRIRSLLDQLSNFQHQDDRVKGALLTTKLAQLVEQSV